MNDPNSQKIQLDGIAYSLEDLEQDLWLRLQRATHQPKEAFYTGVVANRAGYGISLRTVVLRKVIIPERKLLFHSDRRSAKIQEIEADPQLSWLFYDNRRKIQLRLAGRAQIHRDDALADQIWQESGLGSRKLYLATQAPATVLPEPGDAMPKELTEERLNEADVAPGWVHFSVVVTKIHFADWLYLGANGHRRARFVWQAGHIERDWISP
ncbi:MAG: hypothetical protein HC880_13135 [Bacteroidia bacterium]|nr:hypothetical protein [Bacteroidia bacterium]